MAMEDLLYNGQLLEHKVAFTYGVMTQVVNEAVLAHDCDPVSAHVLGRALAATLLICPQLAEPRDRVNAVWQYHGDLRSVVVDAGGDGTVRGLVSPRHLAGLGEERASLYGDEGSLKILRSREGELLTSGSVAARLQDVVADLEFALCVSDQVESGACVMIGFQPDAARPVALCQGLLIQAMPEADPAVFQAFRDRLQAPELRQLLARSQEADNSFEHIVRAFTGEEDPAFRINECPRPQWQCTCNEEKMGAVLITLPEADRVDILEKNEAIKIRCEFCNHRYELSPDACRAVWAQA